MRLLNRTAGSMSRHRRRPPAGLPVSSWACSSPEACTPSSPRPRPTGRDRHRGTSPRAASSSSWAARPATDRTARASRPCESGTQKGPPLAGVGAAAVDFQVRTGRMPLAQPGAQAQRKPPVFGDEEVAQLAAYVASLAPGPRSDQGGLLHRRAHRGGARGGHLPRRPDLPHQLHRLPQLRRLRRRDAPRRPGAHPARRQPQVHLRGAADRPAAMPNFSNGNLSPEEKRDVIAYLSTPRPTPATAASASAAWAR